MLQVSECSALRPRRQCRFDADTFPWAKNLPAEWRDAAVIPLAFTTYREYELPAARTLGHDEDGSACYCKQHYVLNELRSDDGEEFYQAVVYAEAMEAWLLRDGRWLIHRFVQTSEEGGRGFFCFSDSLPR